MSKNRCQCESCNDCTPKKDYEYDQHDDYKKEPKCHAPKEAILACGRGFDEDRLDIAFANLPTTPIVLARVAIDASCLCRPIVKIDFSTIFHVTADDTAAFDLVFALIRTCNGTREVVERFRLEFVRLPIIGVTDISEERIFAFTYCDHDYFCHKKCCSYTVELISATGVSGTLLEEFDNRNTAINAIAQGLCD